MLGVAASPAAIDVADQIQQARQGVSGLSLNVLISREIPRNTQTSDASEFSVGCTTPALPWDFGKCVVIPLLAESQCDSAVDKFLVLPFLIWPGGRGRDFVVGSVMLVGTWDGWRWYEGGVVWEG